MQSLRSIDPVVTFCTSQGESVRGTLIHTQRRALVMEVYNLASVVQISEVLHSVTVHSGERVIYNGKATVNSLLNTGLVSVVSVTLTDEWSDLNAIRGDLRQIRAEAQSFVQEWGTRFRINRSYQVVVSEFRAFLSETSRWVDHADMSEVLPREEDGRIRQDVFYDLAEPIMQKGNEFLAWFEQEARQIPPEEAVAHRGFAQTALHPLLLPAPFVYRTFTKPMGYAGDYEMVNQILGDPRQGVSTYFQMINTLSLKMAVAQAHRNRIDILTNHLHQLAQKAQQENRQIKVLNVGCGPAMEVRRFIDESDRPESLAFKLVDFSEPTLNYTRSCIEQLCQRNSKTVDIEFINESVQQLLKRASKKDNFLGHEHFDFVYCAGLFDYLSDKVCLRLLQYFSAHICTTGTILVTNVHACNPQKALMEHLLEWYLIYRDEEQLKSILPPHCGETKIYLDETGVNVFAEFKLETEK